MMTGMCLVGFETEFISAFFSEESLCIYQEEGQISLLFGELSRYDDGMTVIEASDLPQYTIRLGNVSS